ncbi:MAG TPA: hypothetical protein VK756_07760 [Solirubrobacteraceae bacterium]|jgi:hypothetical protein|nr:hypothetical protein [Solirubrobacteraceae bacterium]
MNARQNAKSVVLEASITRADGTVEPQGVVAVYYRSPVKRAWARLRGIKGKATVTPCA